MGYWQNPGSASNRNSPSLFLHNLTLELVDFGHLISKKFKKFFLCADFTVFYMLLHDKNNAMAYKANVFSWLFHSIYVTAFCIDPSIWTGRALKPDQGGVQGDTVLLQVVDLLIPTPYHEHDHSN